MGLESWGFNDFVYLSLLRCIEQVWWTHVTEYLWQLRPERLDTCGLHDGIPKKMVFLFDPLSSRLRGLHRKFGLLQFLSRIWWHARAGGEYTKQQSCHLHRKIYGHDNKRNSGLRIVSPINRYRSGMAVLCMHCWTLHAMICLRLQWSFGTPSTRRRCPGEVRPSQTESHRVSLPHSRSLARNLRERHSQGLTRRHFFKFQMTNDLHATMEDWRSSTQNVSK